MFKKVALTLVSGLLLVGMAFAQPGMGQGQGRGRGGGRGTGPGMGLGPCGMGMGPGMGSGAGMGMGRGMRMGRMGGPGPMAVWKDKELLKKAGISPDQAKKIRDLHFQNQRDGIKLSSEMRLKNLEMAELMDSDKPDEGKIRAKARDISALREKMYMQGVEQGLTMKKLITPEQEQKLRDAMLQPRSDAGLPPDCMMFGMGPEMMGPGPDFGSSLPPMPDAPEPPEGLE